MEDVHTHRLHAVGVVAQMPQLFVCSLFFKLELQRDALSSVHVFARVRRCICFARPFGPS